MVMNVTVWKASLRPETDVTFSRLTSTKHVGVTSLLTDAWLYLWWHPPRECRQRCKQALSKRVLRSCRGQGWLEDVTLRSRRALWIWKTDCLFLSRPASTFSLSCPGSEGRAVSRGESRFWSYDEDEVFVVDLMFSPQKDPVIHAPWWRLIG